MAIEKILNKRSNAVVTEEGVETPKKPTSSQLDDGEIAVNYHKGTERIFIKNDNEEVVDFISKDDTDTLLAGKQNTINDLAAIRSGAQSGATAYQMPSTGIPATDLASDVQSVLAAIVGISELIPAQASSDNKLADKNFVNSSIATNTANYISDNGQPFQSVEDLEAYSGVLTNNDYAFVVGVDSVGNTTYSRYKYNASTQQWALEYVLNNSSFTAEQWAAINSSITSALVTKLSALPTNSELATLLNGKANKIPMPPVVHDLIIEGTTQVSDVITLITGYFYPRTYTQIDSNYTNPAVIEFTVNYTGELRFTGRHESGGILEYIKAYVNGTLVETSTENITSATLNFNVEANDVVKVEFTRYVTDNFTGCIGNLSITSAGVPKDLVDVYNSLAPVATSGSYNDLSDKPTIPDITGKADKVSNATNGNFAALDSNGNLIDSGHKHSDYITQHQDLTNYVQKSQTAGLLKNDGTVDTNTYLTQHQDISGKADKSEMSVVPGTGADADKTTITLKQGASATVLTAHQDISGKENITPIEAVASGTTTITAQVNKYYEVAGTVSSLTVTLPTPTANTEVTMVVVHLTVGASPTILVTSSATVAYSAAYAVVANKEYELSCLYNGSKWIVSSMEVAV